MYVDNDANCAALAEAHAIAGGAARNLVMLTLGTGVGGGVVIDGRIFRGATGLGAELGHVVVDVARGAAAPGDVPRPRLARGALQRHRARARGDELAARAARLGARRARSRRTGA